jgi:hypothetical protein
VVCGRCTPIPVYGTLSHYGQALVFEYAFDLRAAPRLFNEPLAVCLTNRAYMSLQLGQPNPARTDAFAAAALAPWYTRSFVRLSEALRMLLSKCTEEERASREGLITTVIADEFAENAPKLADMIRMSKAQLPQHHLYSSPCTPHLLRTLNLISTSRMLELQRVFEHELWAALQRGGITGVNITASLVPLIGGQWLDCSVSFVVASWRRGTINHFRQCCCDEQFGARINTTGRWRGRYLPTKRALAAARSFLLSLVRTQSDGAVPSSIHIHGLALGMGVYKLCRDEDFRQQLLALGVSCEPTVEYTHLRE